MPNTVHLQDTDDSEDLDGIVRHGWPVRIEGACQMLAASRNATTADQIAPSETLMWAGPEALQHSETLHLLGGTNRNFGVGCLAER
jgi:hypothetical protein